MAIYDDTVKKYKQYLKDAQIEALMEKSRQYNRENAGNRADAVSQARSSYDTAYRGLQNMGLAGAKGTELTGEVPRLKTNIAGQFNRVNAQLYNREQQAVEALGGQYAAQTKAQQAAAAAARAAAESQAEAEEAAKRNAVGGLVTGAVSAALAGQTKQTKQTNANTATLIPSKGQRIGMETAAKTRGTGGMVTAATAAAIAQQEFEQKKALAAMQALGIRRSKFASSPTQKTAAQTTVNALQSSLNAQQEYLSAMEMLRRAQAGAQKDPRAGSGVAYYADRVGEILSNATIPTEQRVQMAMEYLQADVDEKTSPLADRKAKEIIARAYGLKVPKSDETFDALDKARRSKPGGLGYGVGATYDKDAENAFRQEQSNRAEYNYYMPAIANKIRYAGKTGNVNDKETDFVYNVINGKITEETIKKMYGRSDPGTKYRYLLLDEEEKNAYNYLYENKGLKAANDYAESLMPLLEMRGAEEDQAAWAEYTKEHPVAANIHSIGLSASEIAPAISRVGIGAYNEISGTKNPAYVDTNSTLYSGTNRRTTIRTKTSGMILGDNPTGWQKVKNFAYNTGMSMADSAAMLPFAYAGLPWVSDLVFFSSASNDAYKDAISRGANQADAILAGAASGIAEALFEHVSLDKVVKMSTSGKGKFIMNMLKQAGIEASEEACTSIANLITDKLFLGELSNNELDRKNYIQEYMATGMSREEAEKKANIQVFTDTIKDIGMDALGGFASGLGFGLFGAATNAYTQKQVGKEVKQNSEVLDNDYRVAELLGGETADLARKYDQRSITEMEAGDLHTAIVSKLQEQAEVSEKNAETVATVLDGREISADQAADMLQSSKDFLQEAGYDTSSAEALAASYNQRVEEVATAQKEAFDNRARDYNIKRAEEVYTDKEALRNVPLTLPTGVSPVQFAEAERNNFKSRTTIQSDGVELQLSLMDMDGRFTNEQKLERARKAMTAQAQRKLDMIGKMSKALGMDVVVHDYMRGSNGYFGEDGKIHFVLSGHMSVARVAAHELTHQMQSVASEKYTVVRDQLIEDVGQDRFDRLLKRKAAQYGYNMESEQGRLACDEEVIAELCEGMLSDKDRLERFAERHTDTALTLKERLTKILNAIHATLKDTFGQNQNRISDMITDEKTADKWLDGLDEVLKKVQERKSTLEGAIGETANVTSVDQDNLVEELKEAKTERQVDEKINKYCVDITRSDLAGYRQDLLDSGLVGEGKPISQKALNGLFNLMTKVCDKVSMHRAILDFGPELKTEAEITAAKENRAYVPYKQNADPHYKLALDFSTLCRKRILLQTIAERLQAKMGRAVTQEETVAIRLELQKLQQEGMQIEVACALCYVEAARLKSPKAINAFLNNPEAYMRRYLAQKVGTAKEQVEKQQRKWKEEHGYHRNETKGNMSAADEKAYNDFSKSLRESLAMDEESERIIARAVDVVRNTPEKLLSAKGVEQLKKSLDAADRTLVDAFVTQVRNSTRSKAQETDTPYVRGDAKRLVPDSVIQYANQESGFRHQRWSDFQVIHMLDTMAAVIELAQRRAKMHAYTKVPAMVEMCGLTGMMINMSLIPHGNTGLDANGNLIFDRVEGMPWDTMMDLRDRFPATAGNIAIGINDAQIRALLASEDIDYVIPYHASGMNKNMRKYLDIRSWTEYTSTQNERGNNRGKKGDAPALAEWFNEAEAVKAKDGNAYMREASEKYLQLCYERNLIPKFSQYLVKGEDGRYSLSPEYENYWKMLVDRKMVNQKTGQVIQQKPVLPVFDDATIMNILDDRLADPAVQDAEKAADIVTSRFANWTKGRNNASAEAIEEAKRIRDRSAALTVQKTVGSNDTSYSLNTSVSEEYKDADFAKNGTIYTYDFLVKQKPIQIVTVADTAQTQGENNHVDVKAVVETGMENALENGRKYKDVCLVRNNYTGREISVSANTLRHGLGGNRNRVITNAKATEKIGEILKNSIPVNGLKNKADVDSTYAMAGILMNKKGNQFIAISTIEQKSDKVSDIAVYDIAHAMNARMKKGSTAGMFHPQGVTPSTASYSYKIQDFLRIVNSTHKSILSESVLAALGETRPEDGTYSGQVLYSLDTEQLEKTVRAIDTKALEKGLQSMNAVSNVNSFTMKDPSRFFDAISKGNESLRDELHDIFEKPHSEATGLYARNLEKMQERVKNIAKEAGVLSQDGKKFDKAASAAVQNIGEGIAPIACSVEAKVVEADTISLKATRNDSEILSGDFTLEEVVDRFGVENGNEIWDKAFDQAQKDSEKGRKASAVEYESTTSPYTMDDLKAQFPTSWERLKAAADAYREMYDEYYENMNAMLREIYPNAFTSKDDTTAKIDALVEKKKHRIADAEQAILEREKTLKKVESEMAGKKRTDTKAYDTLRRRQTRLNESIADLNELIAGYNEDVAALAVKKNAILEDKSGESLSRMHKLEFRKKYFHHFVESEKRNFIGEVWDLIINKNPQQLSPAIVGRSANSKAKSRWAGFFQQRKGPYHTPDAVNGMLRYASLAEYKLAFDPLAAYLRNAEKKIRQINDETNRNSLLLYLNTWTNQILGKSSDFDRLFTDRGVVGRNIVNALQKLNSRVIKNTLYFNARSAIVQISNISNAVSLVTNPKDWKNGVLCWSKAAKGDEMMQNIMSQSNFLASRFAGVEMIDTSTMAKAEKFANWMLSIADTISAKATWWAAYNQYVRNPNSKSIMSMPRKYESAVDYADDVTRRTHGGRGVGEKAPIMTSKLVSFFAPFQLEVNNTYQLLKENIKKKNALGIATMEATVFVMNAVFEAVVGSTVLPFDFVRALIDILFGAKDILDDDDDDHKLASTFKLIGQRLGAETVSGLPYAGMIPQFLGEDTTKAVFGETDMTKYGNVNMGVGGAVGIGKVLASLAKWGAEGVKPDWFSMVNELSEVLPPIGGKQIARTIGGLTTVAQGYSGKTNSKGEDTVQFATDTNVLNYIHAGIFGKWALTEASEYFGEDRILPKLFGYYNGESASAGSPVKAEEFQAARALGLSGKGYFTIRKELKGYRTQEGKRSSLYTTNLTPAQKAGMDALLICTTGESSEAKSEGAIVYGRTKQEDGSWGEWKVKADYSSEDLFKLSLYGDTKYSAGTTALKNGAGIKNVLGLLDTVDAYNDANEKPMTATQKRDWLHQNVKDTKQAALLDAYILSKNKSTNVKVEGNVVYTMSLGEDGKPSVANDGTVAEWKVKADYTDDTWYAISQHGDSKYQKGLTAVRKGANPKTIRKYLDDMQAYQDSHKNQSMSSEERGQWIRKNGGTPKEQAILDAYMLRKDSNTDAKVKDGIVYTLELGEDGKPKVYKSGSVAEWKVKADYTSDEWYAASQTDYYNKAKTAYSACGIKPTVFVDFYTKWSDLSAKDASGKTVSGLKKKRTKELLDKMKISTEQKAYLYYKVCGYK